MRSKDPKYLASRRAAHNILQNAIQAGLFPKAKECICVDCGNGAYGWDHRDYSKPYDVEPVCQSCNIKRGPAAWGVPACMPRPRAAHNRPSGDVIVRRQQSLDSLRATKPEWFKRAVGTP